MPSPRGGRPVPPTGAQGAVVSGWGQLRVVMLPLATLTVTAALLAR
ncbi:hypothetical protein ACFV29_31835 [Streptomyces sp. NPDC059690]